MKLGLHLGRRKLWHVGPFGLCNGAFDGDVIDLPVIITALSLDVEVRIGTSYNCKDCAMCGESIGLLRRFLDLRWRWWIGFNFDLRGGVVWHGVLIYGTGEGYVICAAGKG
jgi:hypothetical protein